MAKKAAILAVDPVNGYGLFHYLEAFFENGIPFEVFAVADTEGITTNSGIPLQTHGTVAQLKERTGEFDALVFACGDAMPKFAQNSQSSYNTDMIEVVARFGAEGKIVAGHCVAGLIFDIAGITEGKRVALHPLVKDAVSKGTASDRTHETDGNIITAQTENNIGEIIRELTLGLK